MTFHVGVLSQKISKLGGLVDGFNYDIHSKFILYKYREGTRIMKEYLLQYIFCERKGDRDIEYGCGVVDKEEDGVSNNTANVLRESTRDR